MCAIVRQGTFPDTMIKNLFHSVLQQIRNEGLVRRHVALDRLNDVLGNNALKIECQAQPN